MPNTWRNGANLRGTGRIALPVTGDDAKAKEVVMKLVNDIGFDPVDAGGLAESWRQQPATPVYATDFDAACVRRALAQAAPERKPEWRATPKVLAHLTRRKTCEEQACGKRRLDTR